MSMARSLTSATLVSAAVGLIVSAPVAGAAPTSARPAPTSARPAPTTPSAPPAPTPAPATSSAPGRMQLILQHVFGSPPFVIAGGKMVVRGIVVPYVGGQRVKVSFYRDHRKVLVRTVGVRAIGNGAGQFHLPFSSSTVGLVQVRAVHYATPLQAQFTGISRSIHFASGSLGPGAQGGSVWLLQSELSSLHYVVPLNGVFDEATTRAMIAYRKMAGLERVSYSNTRVLQLLQRGAGSFRVHYPGDGRHVEADLTRQVLAEIEPHGRVHALYEMSSGKPSTPTVIGRFRVYEKTPGVNAKGMVDSNYFIAGYAIHGYPEVPVYAASHGCLRVPIPNAASIYAWVGFGTPVDVYDEYGGGSGNVRGNAGP